MSVKKQKSNHYLKSDLVKIDNHNITDNEYDDLPDLDDSKLVIAKINKGGRPISSNPKKLISIRLPLNVLQKWKDTGEGWQTRMAQKLSEI